MFDLSRGDETQGMNIIGVEVSEVEYFKDWGSVQHNNGGDKNDMIYMVECIYVYIVV